MAARDDPEGAGGPARKERVLHTRMPDSLDRQLKHGARGLGMSVSTIVRHVLLNTFGLVEDIVNDGTNLALAITGQEAPPAGVRLPADVLAWQEVVLNVNAVCEQCNAVLPRGTRAAVGLRDQPGPRAILCATCLGRVASKPARPAVRRSR